MYIEMEDLVGNAFISYLQATGKRTLALEKIEKFGDKVVKQLTEEGEKPYLRLSRDITYDFFSKYSDWFRYVKEKDYILVILNEKKSVKELIQEFSGYLSVNVLQAFRNPENEKILLED